MEALNSLSKKDIMNMTLEILLDSIPGINGVSMFIKTIGKICFCSKEQIEINGIRRQISNIENDTALKIKEVLEKLVENSKIEFESYLFSVNSCVIQFKSHEYDYDSIINILNNILDNIINNGELGYIAFNDYYILDDELYINFDCVTRDDAFEYINAIKEKVEDESIYFIKMKLY